MIPVNMQSQIDCGRVSAANHVACMTTLPAADLYEITRKFKQPSWWPACDFWDSPSRQIQMISDLSGQPAGLLPDGEILTPCVVLLKLSAMAYHWVTVLAVGHQTFTWHDGAQVRDIPFASRFPGAQVIMAIAIGAVLPLPWKWRLWGGLTKPIKSLW